MWVHSRKGLGRISGVGIDQVGGGGRTSRRREYVVLRSVREAIVVRVCWRSGDDHVVAAGSVSCCTSQWTAGVKRLTYSRWKAYSPVFGPLTHAEGLPVQSFGTAPRCTRRELSVVPVILQR
jgi:hypothetical protein